MIRRVVTTDDLDALGRIVVDAYQALAGRPEDPDYDVELADVAGRVANGVVLGAFDVDGTPLGCVTYVDDASSPYAEHLDDGEASFRMLAVDVDAQGRGIGEALVIACVERAEADGKAAVFFYSGDWMATAHRLYGRLGFTRVPERDWTDGLGLTLLGFRRALRDDRGSDRSRG